MARTEEEQKGISLLGNQHVAYPSDYSADILETFINKHPDNDYFVKFNCPEFTSLCPITGQPDFATIYISYVPDVRMVESKSLKLYLFSFRNHGDFHEDCVNTIMKDLIKAHPEIPSLTPHELRHTRATFWSAQGVPQHLIADLLGHCDTRMLERVYNHTTTDTLRQALEAVQTKEGERA